MVTKSIYWALTGALYIFLLPVRPVDMHYEQDKSTYISTYNGLTPSSLSFDPSSVVRPFRILAEREKETQIEKKAGDGKAKRGVSSPEGIHRVIRGANGCIPSNCHRPAIRQKQGESKQTCPEEYSGS